MIQKFKIFAKYLLGKEVLVKPDAKYAKKRFGSPYGGWEVVTRLLNKDSVVYSFGVGEDASFDISLSLEFDLKVHAFDPTPKSIEWVKRQNFDHNFLMHKYGIAAFDGNISFNPPENPKHVSYTILDRPSTAAAAISVPVKKLGTIMRELGHAHIDLLKLDVEGAEYEIVEDILASEIRPQQILIEFHHRFPGVGAGKTKDAIRALRSMGYDLFSVSPSNEEFGFIRKF